ncbi:uncharacterized protein BCR38DRAFT_439194 [Pseudomassariella vexata]|uniref:Uncharacterized protein n=1 Tax=Pseudomassariella vexata TaxID=1141098 RepID=A0A1Y2DVB8_9PEZI|nr:uncharacterized protein BCR38DRAFT_439194 [Pseudomassariella vexata]ORY62595.1 hypothetical protein BCR38DRAFT_439194 [Pseudomassariella vexata]
MAPIQHPSPSKAFELASKYATLLRVLFYHPRFKYAQPPTPEFIRPDGEKTPVALLLVSDFVQRTYVDNVIPFLPAGATRKCKAIGNPWAQHDPNYQWEWEWDARAGVFKDASGSVIGMPILAENEAMKNIGDVTTRTLMAKKCILENGTDVKARLIIGGNAFDFGEVQKAMRDIDELDVC